MNNDNREKRIEHAREYLNEAIKQNTNIVAGASIFASLLIIIFAAGLYTMGSYIFSESFGTVVLVFLLLILCGSLLWNSCFYEIPKYKKLLQDVDSNLEEIERIEAESKKRIQKSTSSGNASNGVRHDLAYYASGGDKYGWRKYVDNNHHKYHIDAKDYETRNEYEDALRDAEYKNRWREK